MPRIEQSGAATIYTWCLLPSRSSIGSWILSAHLLLDSYTDFHTHLSYLLNHFRLHSRISVDNGAVIKTTMSPRLTGFSIRTPVQAFSCWIAEAWDTLSAHTSTASGTIGPFVNSFLCHVQLQCRYGILAACFNSEWSWHIARARQCRRYARNVCTAGNALCLILKSLFPLNLILSIYLTNTFVPQRLHQPWWCRPHLLEAVKRKWRQKAEKRLQSACFSSHTIQTAHALGAIYTPSTLKKFLHMIPRPPSQAYRSFAEYPSSKPWCSATVEEARVTDFSMTVDLSLNILRQYQSFIVHLVCPQRMTIQDLTVLNIARLRHYLLLPGPCSPEMHFKTSSRELSFWCSLSTLDSRSASTRSAFSVRSFPASI